MCLCQKSRTGQQFRIEMPVFMTSVIVMICEVVRVTGITLRSVGCSNSCFDDKSCVFVLNNTAVSPQPFFLFPFSFQQITQTTLVCSSFLFINCLYQYFLSCGLNMHMCFCKSLLAVFQSHGLKERNGLMLAYLIHRMPLCTVAECQLKGKGW